MRKTSGGYFWDILLLSQYNKDWIKFYFSFIRVLPCEDCIQKTLKFHEDNPIPNFKDQKEKNEYIWNIRLQRGGEVWRNETIEKGWTLKTWEDNFNKPFSRIYK